jgi:hypothetical protein
MSEVKAFRHVDAGAKPSGKVLVIYFAYLLAVLVDNQLLEILVI